MELLVDSQNNSDWWYERGDPSVGIYGGDWIHESCLATLDDEIESHEECLLGWQSGSGMNHQRHWLFQIQCLHCGDVIYVTQSDYDPEGMENDYWDIQGYIEPPNDPTGIDSWERYEGINP